MNTNQPNSPKLALCPCGCGQRNGAPILPTRNAEPIPATPAKPIEEAFIAWTANQPDTETRRWSYEIEAIGLGAVSGELQGLGFDTHCDPSITDSGDCFCSCDQCDHSCDCQNCESNSGWGYTPDHCGECSDTEASPANNDPVTTTHDTDRLPEACEALARVATLDDTCGGHVHVDAIDLSAQQVASVMKLWHTAYRLLPDLIGRDYNRYAEQMSEQDYERLTSEYPDAERYRAVNALNWVQNKTPGRKTTIEFRQFAGTLDPQVIVARGYLCRALVEYAKASKPIYWLKNETDSKRFLTALGLGFIA